MLTILVIFRIFVVAGLVKSLIILLNFPGIKFLCARVLLFLTIKLSPEAFNAFMDDFAGHFTPFFTGDKSSLSLVMHFFHRG